jgi:hypothetical protein
MTATAERASFIQTEFRRAISENPAVRVRYGTLARESADPVETFFDNVADAQAMADERLALLSGEARAFDIDVNGLAEVLALDPTGGLVPNAWVTDERRSCDRRMVIVGVEMDLASQQAQLVVWG